MTSLSGCHLKKKIKNRISSGCQFFFQMTTRWPAHLVVNFFSNDNLMGCYPILIFKSKW